MLPNIRSSSGSRQEALTNAIAQLSCEQREAVILHHRGSVKFREIAGLQGISINTAKSWYRYSMENLRRLLSDNGEKMKSARNIEESIKNVYEKSN
jgi:DNA-directed RNA polymerase specialized sigma24 family protein